MHAFDKPRAVATFSRLAQVALEVDCQLRPYRPMLEPVRWNYASLLMRRDRLEEPGGWDPVQAHGDHGLMQRLKQPAGAARTVRHQVSGCPGTWGATGRNDASTITKYHGGVD